MADGSPISPEKPTTPLGQLKRRVAQVHPVMDRAVEEEKKKPGYKKEDIRTVRRGAYRAAEAMLDIAYSDPVTGLHNRAWIMEEIERETARVTRMNKTNKRRNPNAPEIQLWAVLMDEDNFKKVNTQYGHELGGDPALGLFSKLPYRIEEPVARWGGDEFVQLLNEEITQLNLPDLMGRYSSAMSQLSTDLFTHLNILDGANITEEERIKSLTLTFAAVKWEPGMTREELMQLASETLLQAKREGKNRGYIGKRVDGKLGVEKIFEGK